MGISVSEEQAKNMLKKAKISLMIKPETVFYTTILFSLKQEFTTEIPTLATNGVKLLINPDFFIKFDPTMHLMFLSHEVLHVALDHMHRCGDRDPQLFNIAADHVINNLLVDAGYPMPDFALCNSDYVNLTTEQVYDILNKKTPEEKSRMINNANQSMSGDIQYPTDGADGADGNKPSAFGPGDVTKEQVASIVMRAVTQVKAMGRGIGNVPSESLIVLDRVINPMLPWNTILQNYLTDYAKDDYSFRRANKRFLPKYYLPTAYSESIGHIAIAVDCSGSVTDEEFNVFIGKIDEIQKTTHPKKITVVAFDSEIKSVQTLTDDEDAFTKLEFVGRGGTRIEPVLDWAEENKPTVMLIFTDGEFYQKEPKSKDTPFIWVINNNSNWETPYGPVIHFDI